MANLDKKIDQAIKLLQQADKAAAAIGQPVEVCYSGGKDSDVILRLAQMAGINYRAIYKNTSIDPSGTIKHCKDNGVEIFKPKETFLQLISKRSLPSRFSRFCCGVLKEYKVLDKAVVGIRRSESTARAKRYTEPTQCRYYGSKKNHVEQFMPILEWTDADVEDFVNSQGVKCHPLYYDEQGKFHVERRLGCLCCPLSSQKKRIEEFKKHPNMLKLYLLGAKAFMDSHPEGKSTIKFDHNPYRSLAFNIFCKSYIEFNEMFGKNLFGESVDCKDYLERCFGVDLSLDRYIKNTEQ